MKKILISILLLAGLVGVGIASWVISDSFITPTEEVIEPSIGDINNFLPPTN